MPELIGGGSSLGWVAVKAVLLFVVAVIGLRLRERRTIAQLSARRPWQSPRVNARWSGAPLVAGLIGPPDVHDLDGQVTSRAERLVRHRRPVHQTRPV